MRASIALAACLALAASSACGDSGDPGAPPAAPDVIRPLITVAIPAEAGPGWDLPETGVKIASRDGRTAVIFASGSEPLSMALPTPAEAEGAGHVSLRVMSDGPFAMQLTFGSHETRVVRSGETRRHWKELMFSLHSPLSPEALAEPTRITRISAEGPVMIEAVRFLP